MNNDSLEQMQSLIKDINDKLQNLSERYNFQQNILSAYHKRYPGTSDRFSGRGIIYSVITGNYDNINEPLSNDDYEYVLLTDHEPQNYNGKWQIRIVENRENLSAPRLSRYLKMHPSEFFPEYDYSIYVDGSLQVVGDFKSFIALYKKESGIICFPHHLNCDILEEAGSILENGNASQDELVRQIKNYQDQGYTGKGYIVEAGCMVRDHRDELLMKVMDDWWKEFCSYDHNRDQMSFDYSFWKNGYNYDLCDLPIYDNPWCRVLVIH
jgi:hypothetical protein